MPDEDIPVEVVVMSTMTVAHILVRVLHCTRCGDERDFVRPPCPDGHEGDCPDLMCFDCGSLVG